MIIYEFVDSPQTDQEQLRLFIKYVFDKLHIDNQKMPDIIFSSKKEGPNQHRTGWYNPNTDQMWIYTGHRNLIDIMRTVAHELAHHKQREDGHISSNTDLAEIETQADTAAGMIMKLYVRMHPEIIK
mgnify:CR=1 FL=1